VGGNDGGRLVGWGVVGGWGVERMGAGCEGDGGGGKSLRGGGGLGCGCRGVGGCGGGGGGGGAGGGGVGWGVRKERGADPSGWGHLTGREGEEASSA